MNCKFSVLCRENEIMMPFYNILGPLIKRNYESLTNICFFSLLNIGCVYTGLLGVVGTVFSFLDIIRIIKYGSVLPCSLWRPRIKAGRIVTAECERDLKLINLVLSMEYYLLLIFGTFTQNPILYLPWLILHAFIISLEFIVFIMRLFVEGFDVSKHGLILSMFMIYNWLSVFCDFFHLADESNFF